MMSEAFNSIAIDVMGGDLGPAEMVGAVAVVLKEACARSLAEVYMVGKEEVVSPLLKQYGLANNPRIICYPASEVIGMKEKPIQSLKTKKDSSMVRALELVKSGQAQMLLSCGNTGSLMAGGTLKLRPISGFERPALATVIPSKDHRFVLIDVGANPDAKPEHLMHNAILGVHYAKIALQVKTPRVGLLTIGTEEGKGNDKTQEAHQMLKQVGEVVHYVGPIEGFQLFRNHVDVVVCDGFTGNILLKGLESALGMLNGYVKEQLKKNLWRKIGAFMTRGAFFEMKRALNPQQYAGALLLGLRGHIIKAHGSSNRRYIAGALRLGIQMLQHDMSEQIILDLKKANMILQSMPSS